MPAVDPLGQTVDRMLSPDYRDRFAAEYSQLCVRIGRLEGMLDDLVAGRADFAPSCPRSLLAEQLNVMHSYKRVLEWRAIIEGIDL